MVMPSSDVEEELVNFTPTLLPLPAYMPFTLTLRGGERVTVRALSTTEVPLFYAALRAAAADGAGYGWDELPSLEYFTRWYVHDFHNYVIEQARPGGKIISFANFGNSLYSRSVDHGVLSDGNNIILPEFRGKRMSEEFLTLHNSIALDCGFTCTFGETAMTSLATLSGMSHIGVFNTGFIPSGIFFKEHGWVDLVTLYYPFGSDVKSMKERLHASKL